MRTGEWLSCHVFRHDDVDRLLVDQVAPLMSDLAGLGLVHGFFYLRYWEGGPHVRIRALATRSATHDVRERLTLSLRDYLRDKPSRYPMAPDTYAELAAKAAALEHRRAYRTELSPADSVEFATYVPEYSSFGRGQSLALVERHFCESTEIALKAQPAVGGGRLSSAMTATLATLHCLTARSPVVIAPAAGGDEAVWSRCKDELAALAARLRAVDPTSSPATPESAWLGSITHVSRGLDELAARGAFATRSAHPVRRALLRCLHLHLNRLGVTHTQERRLLYLASRAITGDT